MTGIISRGRERIEACNENINKLTNNLGLVTHLYLIVNYYFFYSRIRAEIGIILTLVTLLDPSKALVMNCV